MFEALAPEVTVYEVGPRDGLQNEPVPIPTPDKISMIDALGRTGLRAIEVTSFVHPKWIPQLADAVEVASGVARVPGVVHAALVPNQHGLDRAQAAKMEEIAVFLSASEAHSRKNINKTIAEALLTFDEVIPAALESGMRVRAYVSTVFGCPYEGAVDPAVPARLAADLVAKGCYQVSLGDTIGVANPKQVRDVLTLVRRDVPLERLAVHFHDTRGTALANVTAALDSGIRVVDSALGGLGGCPYAPGASGNLATEDLVYMLHGMGVRTGIDLDALCEVSQQAAALVHHELPSRYLKAWAGEKVRKARKPPGSSA